MMFDKNENALEIPRIFIATEMCKEMLAHGDCGTIEEIVKDAYRFADEILKQGIDQGKWEETDPFKYRNN